MTEMENAVDIGCEMAAEKMVGMYFNTLLKQMEAKGYKGGKVVHVQAGPAKAIDTTGAGDLWASGFLYGYMNGWDMERSGNLGSVVSNEVVQVMGAQIPEDGWMRILAARG